jgi:nicotinamidase-related amidase
MLLDAARSALLVVDLQERLAPAIDGIDDVIANAARLIRAARRLEVPIVCSEQYPKGLGHTVPPIAELLPEGVIVDKVEFSAAANPAVTERLAATGRPEVLVCGIEAHVCVLQTALQLAEAGVPATVVRDACGSRRPESVAAAWHRLDRNGVELVTTEMVVFEWARRADSPEFRELSKLIK